MVFRKTGSLILTALIHGLTDFSLITKITASEGIRAYLGAIALLQPFIAIKPISFQ